MLRTKDAVATFGALCAVSACGSQETDRGACAAAPKGVVSVHEAWVRPAEAGGTTALYAVICNRTDRADALTAVAYADADAVELHETARSTDGVVSMAQVERLALPAGASAALAPGGAHVMLIGLEGAIEEGGRREVEFSFERADPVTISATVRRDGEEHAH